MVGYAQERKYLKSQKMGVVAARSEGKTFEERIGVAYAIKLRKIKKYVGTSKEVDEN